MKKKLFQGPIEFKADGEPGEFRAVFSTFNVIDHDNDVTLPGAFKDGAEVRIAYWGHRWQDLPVGRGVIHQDDKQAWVDGRFFMDTEAGSETYKTVKGLGNLQEWSYAYDVEASRPGQFQDQDVRFLERLTVPEVSPVMQGAGIGTHTEDIKGLKPYPNEHSCRLEDPEQFERCIRKQVEDNNEVEGYEPTGKPYTLLICYTEDEKSKVQAFRYDKEVWSAEQARKHCRAHDGTFEAAAEKSVTTLKFSGSPRNPYGTHASRGYPGGRAGWRNAWRIYLTSLAQGAIQGTIRRIGMIGATMKCNLPELSADDIKPRTGACGELDGKIYEKPGDYGLDHWKKPSDDDLEAEDVQLTCQDLEDLKRACLAEIAKRHACEEEKGEAVLVGSKPSDVLTQIEILKLQTEV